MSTASLSLSDLAASREVFVEGILIVIIISFERNYGFNRLLGYSLFSDHFEAVFGISAQEYDVQNKKEFQTIF